MIGFSGSVGVGDEIVDVSGGLVGAGRGFACSFGSAEDAVLKISHGISNFVLFDYRLINLRWG